MATPYMAFYVGDWRRSIDVQSLSYRDRGIWFEILCLMHDAPRRGELSYADGTAIADDQIARMLGLPKQDMHQALDELLRKGVATRNETGALVCRRMVRERLVSEAKKKAGKAGADSRWGSKLIADTSQPLDIDNDIKRLWGREGTEGEGAMRKSFAEWQNYRIAYGKPPKDWDLMWRKQLEFLSQYPSRVAVEIINASIRGNWQGLFPPRTPQTNGHSTEPRKPTINELRTVLEAKEMNAKNFKEMHSTEAALGATWDHPQNRAQFVAMRKEIKALRDKLAAAIV